MHLGRLGKRGGSARRTDEDVCRASRAVAGLKSRAYSPQRIYQWHHEALDDSGLGSVEADEEFVPYTLRHSALTRLAKNCPNPYAIAAAAGHSSITMTQRYVQPQKAEIWQAFEEKSGSKIGTSRRRQMMKAVGSSGGDAE